MSNHWFLNNYVALSFSIYAIEKFSYTQFWQIALTFVALIAYDVSFVFASDVMMTVATEFNAPMKLLIPVKGFGYAMIGIGDIIVPGFLVSMCIRLDFIKNLLIKSVKSKTQAKSGQQLIQELQKPSFESIRDDSYDNYYFWNTMIGYNLGMFVTIFVMNYTKNPQPALLYILPVMILSYLGGGFMRKEAIKMAIYNEADLLKQFEVKIKK